MKTTNTTYFSNFLRAGISVFALSLTCAQSASALEVTAGDYEVYPDGVNIGVLYYQHAETGPLYVNGNKTANNFNVESNIGLARYIRPMKFTSNATVDWQFILPFGTLNGRDDAAPVGSAGGTGDLILGAPVKFLLDPETKDAFSIGTYLYLPTGSYNNQKGFNLGENRWKGLIQLAYVKHFNETWDLDLITDAQYAGDNKNYTAANLTMKQDIRYENQAHVRYNLSPATALSIGYGWVRGADQKVNGVDQNNSLNTQYARLTWTSWIAPTVQVQAQYGRDISVKNGPMEQNRINFRIGKIF